MKGRYLYKHITNYIYIYTYLLFSPPMYTWGRMRPVGGLNGQPRQKTSKSCAKTRLHDATSEGWIFLVHLVLHGNTFMNSWLSARPDVLLPERNTKKKRRPLLHNSEHSKQAGPINRNEMLQRVKSSFQTYSLESSCYRELAGSCRVFPEADTCTVLVTDSDICDQGCVAPFATSLIY
jgi:hypothetical protein